MDKRETVYKIAFSFLSKMNASILREITHRGVTPEEFFTLPTKELVIRSGIRHDHEFDKLAREEAMASAEKEMRQIENHSITPLFLLDEEYPERLSETFDPPIILYKLGEADLMTEHMVSVVGTRKPTPYGIEFSGKLVSELSEYFPDASIVSGLAYGIDAAAHKAALDKGLATIAVVAHGLNMIYPAAHRNLAKEIIKRGGALLSEYPFGVKPFRPHFLARNRIVAGLSQVTVVVESDIKGGAMSTANFAFINNRDLMALPGRTCDSLSSGCNLLIRKHKAHLIESAGDLIETAGWKPLNIPVTSLQRNLFPELEGEAKIIYELLKFSSEPMHMDEISHKTGLSSGALLSLIGELEFDGVLMRHPGNRFSLA